MTLMLKRKADGRLAVAHWYGDFRVNGKRQVIPLGVPVDGRIPDSLRDSHHVDKAFERSRGAAQAVHDRLLTEMKVKANEQKLLERLIDLKTSDRVKSVVLDKLAAAWTLIPRKHKPSKQYLDNGVSILTRFTCYLHSQYPKARDMLDITSTMVKGFMTAEEGRGISAHTWNYILELLRSTFRHLEPNAEAYRKYLATTPAKVESTIHREPFRPEEIKAILDAAHDNDLMRPLIITALSTAMRRGDCALLEWKAVDLASGFITVKTSKTGETVEIPIMPLLREEILCAKSRGGKESQFVFPDAAALYKQNPDGLNVRLRAILHKAGFIASELVEKAKVDKAQSLPVLPVDQALKRGLDILQSTSMTDVRRQQSIAILQEYLAGKTIQDIADAMQISKGAVSLRLNKIEELAGIAIIRRAGLQLPATVRGSILAESPSPRLRRGSLRGWHSFRTTFITLALSAGLPMELVRRVTGHTTVDVVLKHYFRPGREDFRRAMQAAMPKMLTMGEKSPKEEALAIIDALSAKTLTQQKARLRDLVAAL